MFPRHATDVISLVFGTIFAGFTVVWLFTVNGQDVHATRVEDGSVVEISLEGRVAGLNQLIVLP